MSRTLYTNFRWGLTGEPQAMLVDSGRVVDRGPSLLAADAQKTDLGGKFLLPSLTDCHCHILPTGLDLDRLHLGFCQSREAVMDAVRKRHGERPDGWLVAVHCDQNRWGGAHLTRDDLDKISSKRPIFLRQVNDHAGVANSAALALAEVKPDEPDPDNGSFGRDADGKVNGVLYEGAYLRVDRAIPEPSVEEAARAIVRAGESMAAWGITAAADMQTERRHLPAYQRAVELGCPIKLRLYVIWRDVFGPRAVEPDLLKELRSDRLKVAGVKLFADGAIGSSTAAIYGAYVGGTANAAGYSGQLMYSPETLRHRVVTAHQAGFQVAIHAIGDHAFDIVMDAFEATGEPGRHRVEHAMLLSDGQIERLAQAGTAVAMQPEFLSKLGHAYRAQLGPERAATIKRFRSVLAAGVPLAFSSDRPICAGNPWDGIGCASLRPEGFDPAENLSRVEAIQGYLGAAARIDGDPVTDLGPGSPVEAITMTTDPLLAGTPASLAILQDSK